MPTTPKLALPYPVPGDPADVPTDLGELAVRVDQVTGAAAGLATLGADGKVPPAQLPAIPAAPDLSGYQTRAEEGQANGYASLDAGAKVPAAQLPPLGAALGVQSGVVTSPPISNDTPWSTRVNFGAAFPAGGHVVVMLTQNGGPNDRVPQAQAIDAAGFTLYLHNMPQGGVHTLTWLAVRVA